MRLGILRMIAIMASVNVSILALFEAAPVQLQADTCKTYCVSPTQWVAMNDVCWTCTGYWTYGTFYCVCGNSNWQKRQLIYGPIKCGLDERDDCNQNCTSIPTRMTMYTGSTTTIWKLNKCACGSCTHPLCGNACIDPCCAPCTTAPC